jgi:uncharacterized membrane protein
MQFNFSFIGLVHTLASVVAMGVGALVLLRPKGGTRHKRHGTIYVIAMCLTNLTALLIYRLGHFSVFHWMAIGILVFVIAGYIAARLRRPARVWPYFHITGMVLSYYMLIGGAVNEAFLRVDSLQQMAFANRMRAIGMSQMWVLLAFTAVLIYMLVTGRRRYVKVSGAR